MKDLDPLKYFLGIEVAHSKKGIFISQRKYVIDLVQDLGKLGVKLADSPIDPNHRLGDCHSETIKDVKQFQRLVDRLLYMSMTQLDIAYAMDVLSQFMHAPKTTHLEAADKILKFLKKFLEASLLFQKNSHLKVEVFTDAN
ncbi:PREDICTED: uncharacterized protein LOC109114219 [Nelumbo nucifera]|uniref:Uncharacterized protein LOC109114219 n=1 Tax=Nelumbo nucifera TaxID=4432 RepID=A0A1U8PZV9_NELNU|nr:PREDICTED: uncharacterized protein LOC109114219 [Nelumbo nucifera]